MFTNISQLMAAYYVTSFKTFRLSRKGNWVVTGIGEHAFYNGSEWDSSGRMEYYTMTAVYKNDGMGTLIEYAVDEDGYDF